MTAKETSDFNSFIMPSWISNSEREQVHNLLDGYSDSILQVIKRKKNKKHKKREKEEKL